MRCGRRSRSCRSPSSSEWCARVGPRPGRPHRLSDTRGTLRNGQLRYEPVDKRIRGVIGGQVVIDTNRALLVWEPKRVVPSYAVPVAELEGLARAPAEAAGGERAPSEVAAPHLGYRPVYDPSVPFAVHTAAGTVLD